MTPRFPLETSRFPDSRPKLRELPVLFHLMDVSRPQREPKLPAESPPIPLALGLPTANSDSTVRRDEAQEKEGERQKLGGGQSATAAPEEAVEFEGSSVEHVVVAEPA